MISMNKNEYENIYWNIIGTGVIFIYLLNFVKVLLFTRLKTIAENVQSQQNRTAQFKVQFVIA